MKSVSRSGWLVALAMVVLAAGSTAQATVIGYDMEATIGSPVGFENVLNGDPNVFWGRMLNGATQESAQAKFGTSSALMDSGSELVSPFANLDPGSTMTIMAHINVADVGYRPIVAKVESPYNVKGMYDFRIDNGKIGLLLRGSPHTWIQSATAVVTPNTWNHVAATFDNGLVTIYHNGSQVAQQDISGTYGTSVPDVTVGAVVGNETGGGRPLNGYMDDFYFSNEAALDAATIGFYSTNTITSVIPEPATSALLGLGGIMVLIRRRKVD